MFQQLRVCHNKWEVEKDLVAGFHNLIEEIKNLLLLNLNLVHGHLSKEEDNLLVELQDLHLLVKLRDKFKSLKIDHQ